MDNQNTLKITEIEKKISVLILVLMDNQNTLKIKIYEIVIYFVLILVLMDNQNTNANAQSPDDCLS